MAKRNPVYSLGVLVAVLLVAASLLCADARAQSGGQWTSGAPMPSARSEVAAAEVGGKIYVVGGYGGETALEIYDPATDQWSRGAAFPHALHHAAAAGFQGRLYVVGGYLINGTPTAEFHEYDPASNRWRALAALPTSRGSPAAAILDGRLHVVGGVGAGGR